VVVGGGLAGASTAYFLSRHCHLKTIVLEREDHPGFHASGRNAAMVRQSAPHRDLVAALVEGARFLAKPPAEIGPVHFRACGSVVLADDGRLRRSIPPLVERRVPVAWMEPTDVHLLVPLATGASFAGAMYTLDDGVVDVSALLHGYLRAAVAAGASVLTGQAVRAIRVRRGAVCEVDTDSWRIDTRAVVNAAGAWCGQIARLAGAVEIGWRPARRHLMHTGPLAAIDGNRPILWDEAHGLYFRPESGGLLLSPCDEADHPPGEPAVDPGAVEQLADKLMQWMPRLAEVPIRRTWAGLRTLTPDGRFVVGADPRVGGFFWCAGLGGHGVTASASVGRMAADAVVGRPVPAAHDPARFLRAAVTSS